MLTTLPQLIHVTGKGGVGKSSVAAGLAIALGRIGKNVALVEFGQQVFPRFFDTPPSDASGEVASPQLTLYSLHKKQAFEHYGRKRLGSAQLYRAMFDNRFTQSFLDAVPGLGELMCLGQIIDMLDDHSFDHIIVDLPATGHGLAVLDVPQVITKSVSSGPLHRWCTQLGQHLRDPQRCGVIAVTTCEELAVNEAAHICTHIQTQGLTMIGAIANRYHESPLPLHDTDELESFTTSQHTHPDWTDYLERTRYLQAQWHSQQEQHQRLTQQKAPCWIMREHHHGHAQTFANCIADQIREWQ